MANVVFHQKLLNMIIKKYLQKTYNWLSNNLRVYSRSALNGLQVIVKNQFPFENELDFYFRTALLHSIALLQSEISPTRFSIMIDVYVDSRHWDAIKTKE